MTMVDTRGPPNLYQLPARKPVPAPHFSYNNGGIRNTNKALPDSQLPPSRPSYSVLSQAPQYSTTTSSPSSYQTTVNTARTTPSIGFEPSRTNSTTATSIRRSTSSRSGASLTPTSYVALMRKQKATVWCDRGQHEDPRMLAQQKAAKMRATMEVDGGISQGRTSTSGSMGSGSLGVRSKIRNHVVSKASGYSYYPNMVGGGVPMRLSASEVGDEGNDEDDADSQRNLYHQRTSSGRSSLGSNKRLSATNLRPPARYSQGSTPPNGQDGSPNEDIPELEETPVPEEHQRQASEGNYFVKPTVHGGSGSSSERESSFGNVGNMNAPTISSKRREDGGKSSEELRRRGSVDERAQTMTGVRLFVANPDLSD